MGSKAIIRSCGIIAVFLMIIVFAADQTCRRQVPCPSGSCTEATECVHGECSEKGLCRCRACWEGEACDIYENFNKPYFPEENYKVHLLDSPKDGEHIFTAVAFDDDDEDWTASSPCAKIIYGLRGDHSDSVFSIFPNNGSIHIKSAQNFDKSQYRLIITAVNEQIDGEATEPTSSASLTVIVVEEKKEGSHLNFAHDTQGDTDVHHRAKREVPVPNKAIPDNATFTIHKMGKYENVTTLRVGEKVKTQLMIHFPMGTTDMYVELFTPLNQTTIMKLCNPVISHVGENLKDFNRTLAEPSLEAQDGSTNYDRAVIELGNVTNDGSNPTNYTASMIYIDFIAIVIDTEGVANNSKQWLTAGAAYNDQEFIWVGQAAYEIVQSDNNPPRPAQFNFTGPTEMALDTSAVFKVDMFISHPSAQVRVDAFAPLNTSTVMSVCGIVIEDTADHYSCLPTDIYKADMSSSPTSNGNWHGTLDLGKIINAGSREDDATVEEDRITVSITAHMTADSGEVNEVHDFGVTVAVEDLIWAAQAPVTVLSPVKVLEMNETPVFTIEPKTGTTAYINRPSIIWLEMIVPDDSESIYELEVVAPTNTTIDFKVCSVSVIYVGDNIACVRDVPAQYFVDENATLTNRAVLSLGAIKNNGIKPGNKDANTLRFEIVVQALNSSEYNANDKFWVTMGMNFTESKLWVGQQAFFIQQPDESEVRTNPTFEMSYSFGDEYVQVGDSQEILYKMYTTPGAVYIPAYLEIIMPNSSDDGTSSPLFTICEVKVVSVGKNIPCLNASETTQTVEYEEKHVPGKRDKAVLRLHQICNTGTFTDNEENMVLLSVIVKVEDHPQVQNGTVEWVSVGIMLTNDTMWVGQVVINVLRDTVRNINPNSLSPYVGLELTSNLTSDVPAGYFLSYTVYVKIPPRTSLRYALNATSLSEGVSICTMSIADSGEHLPCMDKTLKPTFSDFPGTYHHQSASLDLGPISSYGPETWEVNRTKEYTADTIKIDLYVKMTTDATKVVGTHTIEVKLFSSDGNEEMDRDDIQGTNTQLDITSNDTVNLPPNVTFFMVDVYDTLAENMTYEIGRGEAKRFLLDVEISEPFLAEVEVKFFTPLNNDDGDVEICDAHVLSIGSSFPCLHRSEVQAQYDQRSGMAVKDVAVLDLGYVCFVPSDEEDNDRNKIRLEGIMKIRENSTVTAANVTSSVRVGDTYIILTDMTMTVLDEATMPEFKFMNETNSTLPGLKFNLTSDNMTIGEIMTIPVMVSIPANSSSEVHVDMKLQVNDSAHMTVKDMRVISGGRNLACLYDFNNVNYTYRSTQDTSQIDFGIVYLGLVTNTGFTYRSDEFQEVDDQILVEFDVQMADSIQNLEGSYHEVSVAVEYGGIIILSSHYIKVVRTNYEKPELEIIADFNYTNPLSKSDTLLVNAKLRHLNTSTAEGINVTASFYLPPYVTFLTLNYTSMEATVDRPDGSVVRIEFPQLLFTDFVMFGIFLQVLSNASTPSSLVEAITPYEASFTMYPRDDNTYTGQFFTTELKDISYRVTAMSDSDCSTALGIQDGRILDCQISGSVSPDSSKLPQHGRLGAASGWSPYQRTGKFEGHRYMEVYFGNKTKVSSIRLQNVNGPPDSPSKLQIFYSDDGLAWYAGDKIIPSPIGAASVDLPVITPRESRYIRIYILESQNPNAGPMELQVEFFGCVLSSDILDACPDTLTPMPEFKERSFLFDGTSVYACDADPNNDLTMRCVSSSDGSNWRVLDKSVANVIGYSSATQEIYALASDKVSYMSSIDSGQTWSCILPQMWNSVKSGATPQKAVPWDARAELKQATPHADFTLGPWGALADGLYFNSGTWAKRLDWMNCC